jgi:DNA topoisomerase IA
VYTSCELIYGILVGLEKIPIEQSIDVVKNIKNHSRDIDDLILWLDCDREGEAIAFDVSSMKKIALEIF